MFPSIAIGIGVKDTRRLTVVIHYRDGSTVAKIKYCELY